LRSLKKEIEITDANSDIDNSSQTKTTSASFIAFSYGLPRDLYLKHIKLAEDGMPESQYYAYIALRQCSYVPLTYEGLVKSQEKFPRSTLNLEKRFKKCKKFAALLNKNTSYANRSFKELADMWKDIAFDNEYPLAISNKMMFDNTNSYSIDDKRTALQNTIRLGRYEGYNHVSLYYLVQSIRSKDVSRIDSRAWIALTCYANEACSMSEYLKVMQWELKPFEFKK